MNTRSGGGVGGDGRGDGEPAAVARDAAEVAMAQLFSSSGVSIAIFLSLYLFICFSLTYPLIAEKKLPPIEAIIVSFKLVNKGLNQFLLLFSLLAILFFIAIIPAGLGLIFFMPFYYNLMGIVYRQLCGVGVVATETSSDDNSGDDHNNIDHFEA